LEIKLSRRDGFDPIIREFEDGKVLPDEAVE
jgi:hypothetical protein